MEGVVETKNQLKGFCLVGSTRAFVVLFYFYQRHV